MDKSKSKNEKLIFVVSIMVILLATATTIVASVKDAGTGDKSRNYREFSGGWISDEGRIADIKVLVEDGRIRKVLPEISEQSVLYFNARNVDVDVYIDDELVYKHKKTDDAFLSRFYGKTSGSDFVEIPIYTDYSGKTIYIDVHNPYTNTRMCKISDMYLGSGSDIVKRNVTALVGTFCFCVIIIFLGGVFIVIYFPLSNKGIVGKEILYLGLAASATGICMITDCRLLQMTVGHSTLYYTVSQLFMSLIPIPLLLFFGSLYGSINKKIVGVIAFIITAVFTVCFFLNLFGIKDYHEMGAVTLLMFIVVIVYIAIITARDILSKKRNLTFHNIGAVMIVIASTLDTLLSGVDLGIAIDTSFFTRFGMAGFMCMECAQVLRNHVINYEKGLHTQFIGNLAYHDGLTNLLNRTSFMEDMERLEHEENPNTLIAMFDINNLKYVNDNYGHTTGDDMIITVAEAFDDFFGDFGKCYRIGGDEMVLIVPDGGDDVEEKYVAIQNKFIRHILQLDEMTEYPLSVAVGYAIRKDIKKTVKDVLDEADAKMYVNKKDMKSRMRVN